MTPNILWLCEFVLEAAGAFYAFKKNWTLFAYLFFCAFADVVSAVLMLTCGPSCYAWANHFQGVVQYVLLAFVAVRTAGAVLRADDRAARFYAAIFGVLWLMGILYFYFASPLTTSHLLKFQLIAQIGIGSFTSYAMHYGAPGGQWKRIGHGLILMAAWDFFVTALRICGIPAAGLYPLGAIAGLGMLLWAVRKKEEPLPIGAVRLGLGFRTSWK